MKVPVLMDLHKEVEMRNLVANKLNYFTNKRPFGLILCNLKLTIWN